MTFRQTNGGLRGQIGASEARQWTVSRRSIGRRAENGAVGFGLECCWSRLGFRAGARCWRVFGRRGGSFSFDVEKGVWLGCWVDGLELGCSGLGRGSMDRESRASGEGFGLRVKATRLGVFDGEEGWSRVVRSGREKKSGFGVFDRKEEKESRGGKMENFVIKPYSPHRFSRQFGYLQNSPGVLEHNIRESDLKARLRYWRMNVMKWFKDEIYIPKMFTANIKSFFTIKYKKWWDDVQGNFLADHIDVEAPLASVKI